MSIPVTLLSGYLGAGKTSVVNHLLTTGSGLRITVLVNDFGAINVDARLIADKGADTITLTNGCACCSIDDDLGSALEAQVRRIPPADRIVIEASGVAEARRIAQAIEAWPALRLDAVVTIVDAGNVRVRASDKFVGRLVCRQIAAADLVLLNKIDLVDQGELQALRGWLQKLAPAARILDVRNGEVAPTELFGARLADATELVTGGQHRAPSHEDGHLNSTTVPLHMNVDVDALRALLEAAPAGMHRIKGFVRDRQGQVMLVQGVGKRVCIEPYEQGEDMLPMGLVCIATDTASLEQFIGQLAAWAQGQRRAAAAAEGITP